MLISEVRMFVIGLSALVMLTGCGGYPLDYTGCSVPGTRDERWSEIEVFGFNVYLDDEICLLWRLELTQGTELNREDLPEIVEWIFEFEQAPSFHGTFTYEDILDDLAEQGLLGYFEELMYE